MQAHPPGTTPAITYVPLPDHTFCRYIAIAVSVKRLASFFWRKFMGNCVLWPRKATCAGLLGFFLLFSIAMQGQDGIKPVSTEGQEDWIKPIPILTGSTGYFTRVTGGQFQDSPSVSPLLLVPVGDKWLIEVKGNTSDTFAKNSHSDYEGTLSYGLIYGQVDYIANRYVTLAAGRFTTPFG